MQNTSLVVKNPELIKFTITSTFTLAEWRKIKKDIKSDWQWPMSDLASAIDECVSKAEREFIPEPPSTD